MGCGEEEEAKKKKNRGAGELALELLGFGDGTQAGARGKVGKLLPQPNFAGIGVVMPPGARSGGVESISPPTPGLILWPSVSQ